MRSSVEGNAFIQMWTTHVCDKSIGTYELVATTNPFEEKQHIKTNSMNPDEKDSILEETQMETERKIKFFWRN